MEFTLNKKTHNLGKPTLVVPKSMLPYIPETILPKANKKVKVNLYSTN